MKNGSYPSPGKIKGFRYNPLGVDFNSPIRVNENFGGRFHHPHSKNNIPLVVYLQFLKAHTPLDFRFREVSKTARIKMQI